MLEFVDHYDPNKITDKIQAVIKDISHSKK